MIYEIKIITLNFIEAMRIMQYNLVYNLFGIIHQTSHGFGFYSGHSFVHEELMKLELTKTNVVVFSSMFSSHI